MRQVEFIMGMPITVDIVEHRTQNPTGPAAPGQHHRATQGDFEDVFNKVFNRLREIDERYSAFKKQSELSRFQRGEVSEKDLSAEFKKIIKACQDAEKITDGYFSAFFAGKFDPTGYVKGWAIAQAGKIIEESGFKTYCVGAGGDILASSGGQKVWNIGIQDPTNKQKILTTLSVTNGAVATSGNYERGKHIINPKTHKPANKFQSVTITGPDIIKADVLATATFAAGNLRLLEKHKKYQAFVVPKTVI